ncbi:collagen alpha-2(I) chain-like [Muntiacus reevesi]|uniref:collagen alpha-2(I) chain-like n=1 Tax=Muntiacus reevesi TaxID=9886 RepID=UPI003307043E
MAFSDWMATRRGEAHVTIRLSRNSGPGSTGTVSPRRKAEKPGLGACTRGPITPTRTLSPRPRRRGRSPSAKDNGGDRAEMDRRAQERRLVRVKAAHLQAEDFGEEGPAADHQRAFGLPGRPGAQGLQGSGLALNSISDPKSSGLLLGLSLIPQGPREETEARGHAMGGARNIGLHLDPPRITLAVSEAVRRTQAALTLQKDPSGARRRLQLKGPLLSDFEDGPTTSDPMSCPRQPEPKLRGETRGCGQSDPAPAPGAQRPQTHSSLPSLHVSILSPAPGGGRQSRALKTLHKTPRVSRQLRLPSTQLAQPPVSPAKAWHHCPGHPSPCQQAREAQGRGQIAFPAGSALLPQEKASVFPPPAAPAWLRGTRAPGCKVTGPHGIHLQPHQLPGNRIPAADDSRGLQDRAPIQRPLEPAWPNLAAASPTWALLRLGTDRPEPVLPRPPTRPGATGGDGGLGHAPPQVPGTGESQNGLGLLSPPASDGLAGLAQPWALHQGTGCSLPELREAAGDGQGEAVSLPAGSPTPRLLPGGHLWAREEEGDGAAREGSGAQPRGLGAASPSWAARPGSRGSFLASRAPPRTLATQTGQMSAGSGVPWPAAGPAQTKALARRHPAFQRLGHELPVTQLFCPGDQGPETASHTVLGGVQSLSDADGDLDGTDLQGSVLPPASRTLGLPCSPSLPARAHGAHLEPPSPTAEILRGLGPEQGRTVRPQDRTGEGLQSPQAHLLHSPSDSQASGSMPRHTRRSPRPAPFVRPRPLLAPDGRGNANFGRPPPPAFNCAFADGPRIQASSTGSSTSLTQVLREPSAHSICACPAPSQHGTWPRGLSGGRHRGSSWHSGLGQRAPLTPTPELPDWDLHRLGDELDFPLGGNAAGGLMGMETIRGNSGALLCPCEVSWDGSLAHASPATLDLTSSDRIPSGEWSLQASELIELARGQWGSKRTRQDHLTRGAAFERSPGVTSPASARSNVLTPGDSSWKRAPKNPAWEHRGKGRRRGPLP